MAHDCDIVTNKNIATTHSLRIEKEILPGKLLKDNLSESFDLKENVNSDLEFPSLNFHSKKFIICLEIITWIGKDDQKA